MPPVAGLGDADRPDPREGFRCFAACVAAKRGSSPSSSKAGDLRVPRPHLGVATARAPVGDDGVDPWFQAAPGYGFDQRIA